MFNNIKSFIMNLWNFKKFLWVNRWWDSHFIFFMLREKLKVDVKYYKKYGHHLYVQRDIDKMELCIKLLNRIIDEDYLTRALIPFNKKYPEYEFEDIFQEWKDEKNNNFHKCCKVSERQEKQDIEYLFKYLSKHTRSWWD